MKHLFKTTAAAACIMAVPALADMAKYTEIALGSLGPNSCEQSCQFDLQCTAFCGGYYLAISKIQESSEQQRAVYAAWEGFSDDDLLVALKTAKGDVLMTLPDEGQQLDIGQILDRPMAVLDTGDAIWVPNTSNSLVYPNVVLGQQAPTENSVTATIYSKAGDGSLLSTYIGQIEGAAATGLLGSDLFNSDQVVDFSSDTYIQSLMQNALKAAGQ